MNISCSYKTHLPKGFDCIKEHFSNSQLFGYTVDGSYHFWSVETLWRETSSLKPKFVGIELFHPKLNCWFPDGTDIDLDYLLDHFERMKNSSLDSPILVTSSFDIIDGNHRFLKARYEKKQKILVIVIETFPPPEFILEGGR